MRPSTKPALGALLVVLATIGLLSGSVLALEPDQEKPKRLYSNRDSITRAVDAFFPLDNLNLSWVNGYHGFWQPLFGLRNVNAHNQRISEKFGKRSRKNWIAAQNGAQMEDFKDQAADVFRKNTFRA